MTSQLLFPKAMELEMLTFDGFEKLSKSLCLFEIKLTLLSTSSKNFGTFFVLAWHSKGWKLFSASSRQASEQNLATVHFKQGIWIPSQYLEKQV